VRGAATLTAPHTEGGRGPLLKPAAVTAAPPPPRLYRDTRGRHGRLREELAAEVVEPSQAAYGRSRREASCAAARAAIGHVTAAPPSSDMNPRRLITRSPRRRRRPACQAQ